MSVFAPKLPSPSELNFCERDAVLYGRNLVLNDLAEHPDRETDYYVRAAVFHVYAAAAYDSTQRDLLASLATHPTTSSLAELSPELFEDHLYSTLRRLSDVRFYWPAQCYWLMCTALGMAQAADALFRADGDARGHAPSSLEAFLLDGFYIPPAAKGDANLEAMSPISRPRARNEEHMQLQVSGSFAERPLIAPPGNGMPQSSAPDNYAVADPDLSGDELNADTSTCSELIEDWLGSKGALSRAERSRRGASARHLITALSLTDSPANRLASLEPRAVSAFSKYIADHPLKPRGERARIAHIKAFLEYARDVTIEVPQLDWDSLTQGGTHGKS